MQQSSVSEILNLEPMFTNTVDWDSKYESIFEEDEDMKEINVKEITNEDVKSFWEKHKDKIIIGGTLLIGFLLNRKINKLSANSDYKFKQIKGWFNNDVSPHMEWTHENIDRAFDNFGIIRNDLNNLATTIGYQGKLGVNCEGGSQ